MKEKDLDKNLENIIIDGLIKEAEQENADFAAAMRKMSEEEFEDMVREPAYADFEEYADNDYSEVRYSSVNESSISPVSNSYMMAPKMAMPFDDFDDAENEIQPAATSKPGMSRFKLFRPWITAAVSAAAVSLIVLIPSINSMNAKLCDSALYMSEAYITAPKGGFDISSATTERIKEELPNLEQQYQSAIEKDGKTVHYRDGFRDAGWTLAVAYLKLHKKSDAIRVLKTLESQSQGTPFGNHCKALLRQLD